MTRIAANKLWLILLLVLVVIVLGALLTTTGRTGGSQRSSGRSGAASLAVDPGTTLDDRPARNFTLIDQLGRRVSLSQYRGRVVLLAFNDSQCTTVCPLTTAAMVEAKALLGSAGSRVALLGVNANPQATALADVRRYSELHGMMQSWRFLTGSAAQLRAVWRAYHVASAIIDGQVDHTPALFVISPAGRLDKVYLTQMSYASVGQQARLLAQEASRLLPAHPRVRVKVSFRQIPLIRPSARVSLPEADGGSVRLGPGTPRLLLFFASWDKEVTDLGRQLGALDAYAVSARARRLPALTAVDEASVEPSSAALRRLLSSLRRPLHYPVGLDTTGRVADGYEVQDEPWLVLVSRSGRIIWYHDVSTAGWLRTGSLVTQVRNALARIASPTSPASVRALLAGSPPPLAALHGQSGRLLRGVTALKARLRALRGYPVVVNMWASWCTPCREEFRLFAAASALYGRHVAFLGVDTGDSPGDARVFLAAHPVSYPSYQSPTGGLGWLAQIPGLPTTVFIKRSGEVASVHPGQYVTLGTLEGDIRSLVPR